MFISERHLINLYSRMPWDIRGNYYIHTGCLHTIGWWYVGNVHCVACVTVESICSGWLCVTFVRTSWFTDCSLGSVHEQSMSHIPRFKGTQVYTDALQSSTIQNVFQATPGLILWWDEKKMGWKLEQKTRLNYFYLILKQLPPLVHSSHTITLHNKPH